LNKKKGNQQQHQNFHSRTLIFVGCSNTQPIFFRKHLIVKEFSFPSLVLKFHTVLFSKKKPSAFTMKKKNHNKKIVALPTMMEEVEEDNRQHDVEGIDEEEGCE
jgi:hypothetical protein